MRNLKKLTLLLAIFSFLFVVSCDSKNDDKTTDSNQLTKDADVVTEAEVQTEQDATQDVVQDTTQDTETPDKDTVKKPPYPKTGASSKNVGDIACNFKFMAVDDKGEKEMELGDFYKTKKAIWLIFSTYDCPPCQQESADIPKINTPQYAKDGLVIIHILNGLLSGPQLSLEPKKLQDERKQQIEFYGENLKSVVYAYLKDQEGLYKYINKGYPVNVMIDASDMSIQKIWEGWDSSGIDDQKQLIEYLLGYYN